jgi:TetR/AcrR family transcriptional regulator, regulator of mycofactocin system
MSIDGTSPGLREQKKALTRATIETRALERFLAHGYEPVRLEDLCAECLVSTRTFFRYFTSKEDLVLGRLRRHLELATERLARLPADAPLVDSLHAVITETVADYSADPGRELARLRLVSTTPALEAGLGRVFAGFERLVRKFAAAHEVTDEAARGPRLIAAATVAAFHVGLDMWVDGEARGDLADMVIANLDVLIKGVIQR